MKRKIVQVTVYTDTPTRKTIVSYDRTDANGFTKLRMHTVKTVVTADRLMRMLDPDRGLFVAEAPIIHPYGNVTLRYNITEPQEFFDVVSVSREDLDRLGFDTSKVDDNTMRSLASKVCDSLNYDNGAFYYAVEYHGEMLEIPRPNPKSIYDDEENSMDSYLDNLFNCVD